jgi:hypothetical protein
MLLDLTDQETAALLRELDGIIDADRYFLAPRIQILRVIRAKMRPEPAREPPPPLRHYQPPRAGRATASLALTGRDTASEYRCSIGRRGFGARPAATGKSIWC